MKGVVYKLRCIDEAIPEFYIGSSLNINQRIGEHQRTCKNIKVKNHNLKVYKFIRSNGGYYNWIFDILEECEVESKEDLVLNYERKYQLQLKPQLNIRVEGRSNAEYYQDNKERMDKYYKEYNETNKEKISIQKKEYREKNKEKISFQKKEYNERNKETIVLKNKEKIQCECGAIISRGSKSAHKKTKKHLSKINIIL
jgi:hypothetical protein